MATPAFIKKTSVTKCRCNLRLQHRSRMHVDVKAVSCWSSVVSALVFGCRSRYRPDMIDIVDFEFDPRKSESNKAKHGIDFIEAQALWRSKHVLLGAEDALDKRYMVIGTIGREHWSAIISYRGARIRIIGRSTAAEIETYAKIAG